MYDFHDGQTRYRITAEMMFGVDEVGGMLEVSDGTGAAAPLHCAGQTQFDAHALDPAIAKPWPDY